MPLFNGTFPPRYVKTEGEVIGVPEDSLGHRLDPDRGRFDVLPVPSYDHAFKTPTLRNVGRTVPYMHNGVYQRLEQVVEFYEKGGGVGLGLKVDDQTLPFDKLSLTKNEKRDLINFMRALDSK
jgi:cytochrome c peroxidase